MVPKMRIDALRIDRSKTQREESRRWLLPLIVISVMLAGGGLWWTARSRGLAVTTVPARVQSTTGAEARTLLNGSGYVTARRAATVSSKVTGKVMEVNIEEG